MTFWLPALSSSLMPQRLEKDWLNLVSLLFVCSKLQLLFLNANIKIKDFFTPLCGLKAIFSYIIVIIFYGFKFHWCFFLLELILADQVLSTDAAKLNPAKQNGYTVTSGFAKPFVANVNQKKNWPVIRRDWKEEKLWSETNMFSPSLVCGINVCLVQSKTCITCRKRPSKQFAVRFFCGLF